MQSILFNSFLFISLMNYIYKLIKKNHKIDAFIKIQKTKKYFKLNFSETKFEEERIYCFDGINIHAHMYSC